MLRIIVFFLFFLTNCAALTGQENQLLTELDWEFQKKGDKTWMPANVPGSVQGNLLRLKQIPDPFFQTNEDSIQWIENENWIFRSNFKWQANTREKQVLIFHGLDCYASIFLNGELLLESSNMFRQWEIDVSNKLKGKNEIRIEFQSPKNYHSENNYVKNETLPHDGAPERPVTRKAAYHFGWDWGPRIVSIGIWRPIELISYKANRIENVILETQAIENERAEVMATIRLREEVTTHLPYKIFFDEELVSQGQIKNRTSKINLSVLNPRLWQVINQGSAERYNVRIEVAGSKEQLNPWEGKFGIRTVALIQEKDSIGTSFSFTVNEKAVFCKGANYIPLSHDNGSHTKDQYRKVVLNAAAANMNMIRVWGGGVYENDDFYDLCDSLGIMVWQDFMFANTMYPRELTKNIEAEVRDNVRRLANHPSIVHWCGNNEINVAWSNWGWQDQYSIGSSLQKDLKANYHYLFENKIPKILREELLLATYSHSSPLSNWGTAENFNHGSMHYWGVFHGADSFEDYATNVGRFNSEYGFQSYPSYSIFQDLLGNESEASDSLVLKHRQKSYKGDTPILTELSKHYPAPKTLKELSYLSQLSQAKGIAYAIQQHRTNRPHCMGSLYWQLNDVWPGISWSSTEYDGSWRALHYRVRNAFADPAVFIDTTGNKQKIILVNDSNKPFEGKLDLSILLEKDGYDQLVEQELLIPANDLLVIDLTEQLQNYPTDQPNSLISGTLYGLEEATKIIHFFNAPKELELHPSTLHYELHKASDGILITLTATELTVGIFMGVPTSGHFSNNYFDLAPHQSMEIFYESHCSLEEFEMYFDVYSLNELVNDR